MYITDVNINIICLNETKISDMDLLLLSNYSILRKDRTAKGGGVAIVYDSSLSAEIVLLNVPYDQNSKVELLCVNFQLNQLKSILVCSIYRAKFYLTESDVTFLESIILELKSKSKWWCLCGDFNIHTEDKTNPAVKKFLTMLKRNNAFLISTETTRENAILDFFITCGPEYITESGTLDPGLSDHQISFVEYKYPQKPKQSKLKRIKRNYNSINFELLGKHVCKTTFTTEEKNPASKIAAFVNSQLQIFKSMAPKREIYFYPRKTHIGLTNTTKLAMKIRDDMRHNWLKFQTESNRLVYIN